MKNLSLEKIACNDTEKTSSPTVRFQSPTTESGLRSRTEFTTFTFLGLIYSSSISGGYGLEESVRAGGPFLTIIFLCLIPFLWGIPVFLCVAELSCAIPSNAGPVMWANVAFAPWFTFCTIIWSMFLNFIDNSLYPTILADYCGTLLELNFTAKVFLKIVFVWSCAIINILGGHVVGFFSVGVMLFTLSPFVLMFLLQLPYGFDWNRIAFIPTTINWPVFLSVVTWNFSGFDSAGNLVEEVKNPNKTYIRVLILVIICALLTYIPPILAGTSAVALKDTFFDQWENGFWVKVGMAVGGYPMALLVTTGGAISIVGLMTTLLATTSSSLAGMSTLNAFPYISGWLSRYHETYSTPINAIIVNSVITSLLSVFFSFEILVEVDQILYCMRIIGILLVFLRLRFKQPFLERPYKAFGSQKAAVVITSFVLLFTVFLMVITMLASSTLFFGTLIMILGTAVASYVWVSLFRPKGFEGELVKVYEDAEIQTYGTALPHEHGEWCKTNCHSAFENALFENDP